MSVHSLDCSAWFNVVNVALCVSGGFSSAGTFLSKDLISQAVISVNRRTAGLVFLPHRFEDLIFFRFAVRFLRLFTSVSRHSLQSFFFNLLLCYFNFSCFHYYFFIHLCFYKHF